MHFVIAPMWYENSLHHGRDSRGRVQVLVVHPNSSTLPCCLSVFAFVPRLSSGIFVVLFPMPHSLHHFCDTHYGPLSRQVYHRTHHAGGTGRRPHRPLEGRRPYRYRRRKPHHLCPHLLGKVYIKFSLILPLVFLTQHGRSATYALMLFRRTCLVFTPYLLKRDAILIPHLRNCPTLLLK